MATREQLSKLEQLKVNLREARIKHGTDYALVVKCEDIRVLCCEIYREPILEAAKNLGITFTTVHTYDFI